MMNQVIDIIQEHIDQTKFRPFLNTFYSVQPKTFSEALSFLKNYMINSGIRTITEFRSKGSFSVNTVTSLGETSINNALQYQGNLT
jgi:hypothetical protein